MSSATLETDDDQRGHGTGTGSKAAVATLALGALGIVYGDIGTSPLYAFRETFHGDDLAVSRDNVLGACSLAFWALVIVISIKYLAFIMRADNQGEGGILALTSRVAPLRGKVEGRYLAGLVILGLFGTALLYGDGAITPAISVLSAVEGLEVATSSVDRLIVPIAVLILVGLFAIQRTGTGAVGRIFGPVMLVWFCLLALLGAQQVVAQPEVLGAVNPMYAVRFFADNGWTALLSLGTIFLVVTGGEALYADMGHFGRRPIAVGWFSLVLPALVLNYFGQGALLLGDPSAIENPFFLMAPSWATYPMVAMATLATVIASQALISGAFSLTAQAVHLGYLPRLRVTHTSDSHAGQVYVPSVNWALMVGTISLVIGFGSASNLAAAYGIAVTGTMAITTVLFAAYARRTLGWSVARCAAITVPFLIVDLGFLAGNLAKIPDGGWFALLVGAVLFVLMTTWKRGRALVAERIRRAEVPVADFLAELDLDTIARVPGTAVFMFRDIGAVPPALLSNVRHNHVLHETVVLLSVTNEQVPRIPDEERAEITDLGHGFYEVVLRFGFMEDPDVATALAALTDAPVQELHGRTTFFLGRENVVATGRPGMAMWREQLFAAQLRAAAPASRFFNLPSDRIFEVGAQVEI